MGNRAVICIAKEYSESAIGIYVHWNGGQDSVEGFLAAARKHMESRGADKIYATGRLIQLVGMFF